MKNKDIRPYSELPTHAKAMNGFYAPFYKIKKKR